MIPAILPYGESGLRLVFSHGITDEANRKIRNVYCYLKSLRIKGVIEHVPCFTSYLLIFDNHITSFDELASSLERLLREGGEDATRLAMTGNERVFEIPVAYGGPDLEFVCSYCGLTGEQVIEIHTASLYTVFAIGFLPGFPYCGPLDKRLFTPRLDTPRVKVPEGSVGITQLQTGVYPFESPGGWRIIGKTNAKLFDYRKAPYSLLKMGDKVRFLRI